MRRIFLGLMFSLWASVAAANVPCVLPFNLQNATTADATQVMANYNALVTCLQNAALAGANNDITSLSALTTPLTPSVGGSTVYAGGTSTGTANAQAVGSVTPLNFSLAAPKRIVFIAGFTNTGATTLNVASTGAINVFRQTPAGPSPLIGGEIKSGNYVEVIYDGTQYELYTNSAIGTGYGLFTTLGSAATVDLATAVNHYAVITGAVTITSFGSTATTAFPFYKMVFTGALLLTQNPTSLILPGGGSITTAANDTAEATYLGAGNWQVTSYTRANGQALAFNSAAIPNYISGLTLSAAGGTGTFGIATGVATDSTNAAVMTLGSAYTKTTAGWAVGTGNGGLDTGAIASTTWYHEFVIQRSDTGVVDICFSLTVTGCASGVGNIPAAYTLKRRIGSMKTDGASQWIAFTQTGDNFIWAAPVSDITSGGLTSASRTATTLTVPPGVVVTALFRATVAPGAPLRVNFTSLQENDVAVTNNNTDLFPLATANNSGSFARLTNTAAQIGVRSDTNSGGGSLWESTYGWIDARGKL